MPNTVVPRLEHSLNSKPNTLRGKLKNSPKVTKNSTFSVKITEELFLSNEDYSNSLSRVEKDIFFRALQEESIRRFSFAKKTKKPIINMVFFGHWGWVFSKIVEEYKKYAKDFEIIPSVYPIEFSSVYIYWRSVNPLAKKFFSRHLLSNVRSEFLIKGIMMLHDSPYDVKRFDPAYKSTWFHKYRWIQCTSVEQCNYVRKYTSNYFYSPLGVSERFMKKDSVNFSGKINIGFVGRAYGDGVKNERSLLKIASMLDSNKYCFTILSSNLQEITENIKSKGYTVYTNKDGNFMELYKKIDVLLILSKYEGTPLPLIESMSLGHTILSTKVGESTSRLEKKYVLSTIEDFIKNLELIEKDRNILKENYDRNPAAIKDNTWENFVKKSIQIWEKM
jgi:hypothetical protein